MQNKHLIWALVDNRTGNKNQILGPILLGVAGITYLGEVYGAWRAGRYYQNIENGNN